jgi:hypothetical protein
MIVALAMSEYLIAATTPYKELISAVRLFLEKKDKEWHHMHLKQYKNLINGTMQNIRIFAILAEIMQESKDKKYQLVAARKLQTINMQGSLDVHH